MFLLNQKTEPTAYVLTPLEISRKTALIFELSEVALSTPRYEIGVEVNHRLEIVASRMTDKIKKMSVIVRDLKIPQGESMQSSFVQGEKDLDPQFADCSVKYYR